MTATVVSSAETRDPVEDLLLDLVAWRTSCPRLPIWAEAVDRGYVRRIKPPDRAARIHATEAGRAFLAYHGRAIR